MFKQLAVLILGIHSRFCGIFFFFCVFLLLWGGLSSRPTSQSVLLKSHVSSRVCFPAEIPAYISSLWSDVDSAWKGKKTKQELKNRRTTQLLRNGNEIHAAFILVSPQHGKKNEPIFNELLKMTVTCRLQRLLIHLQHSTCENFSSAVGYLVWHRSTLGVGSFLLSFR